MKALFPITHRVVRGAGFCLSVALFLFSAPATSVAQDDDTAWHRNLEQAAEIAAKANKPIFVVFRCVR